MTSLSKFGLARMLSTSSWGTPPTASFEPAAGLLLNGSPGGSVVAVVVGAVDAVVVEATVVVGAVVVDDEVAEVEVVDAQVATVVAVAVEVAPVVAVELGPLVAEAEVVSVGVVVVSSPLPQAAATRSTAAAMTRCRTLVERSTRSCMGRWLRHSLASKRRQGHVV